MSYRVVILAPVHQWDDVRVFKKEAISLADEGYDVILVANSDVVQKVDGVTIIPVWKIGNNKYMRFLVLPFLFLQIIFLKGSVYHLHNPDTLIVAVLLKIFRRKVIYDTHEDFTKRLLSRQWIPKSVRSLVASFVGSLETSICKITDASIATQPDVALRIGNHCCVIENPPRMNEKIFRDVDRHLKNVPDKGCDFRLIYIGGVSLSRGVVDMVDAMPNINKYVDARLWLIGPESNKELSEVGFRAGFEYVDYLPIMPQELAFAYLVKSDVGLIYLHDVGGHSKIDPNKLYEYMSFRKPFVASNFEKWKDKVGYLNAGIFVDPGNASLLAQEIIKLSSLGRDALNDMGERGYSYVMDHCWEAEFVKLNRVYRKILS